jgi:hypothetical protein
MDMAKDTTDHVFRHRGPTTLTFMNAMMFEGKVTPSKISYGLWYGPRKGRKKVA